MKDGWRRHIVRCRPMNRTVEWKENAFGPARKSLKEEEPVYTRTFWMKIKDALRRLLWGEGT